MKKGLLTMLMLFVLLILNVCSANATLTGFLQHEEPSSYYLYSITFGGAIERNLIYGDTFPSSDVYTFSTIDIENCKSYTYGMGIIYAKSGFSLESSYSGGKSFAKMYHLVLLTQEPYEPYYYTNDIDEFIGENSEDDFRIENFVHRKYLNLGGCHTKDSSESYYSFGNTFYNYLRDQIFPYYQIALEPTISLDTEGESNDASIEQGYYLIFYAAGQKYRGTNEDFGCDTDCGHFKASLKMVENPEDTLWYYSYQTDPSNFDINNLLNEIKNEIDDGLPLEDGISMAEQFNPYDIVEYTDDYEFVCKGVYGEDFWDTGRSAGDPLACCDYADEGLVNAAGDLVCDPQKLDRIEDINGDGWVPVGRFCGDGTGDGANGVYIDGANPNPDSGTDGCCGDDNVDSIINIVNGKAGYCHGIIHSDLACEDIFESSSNCADYPDLCTELSPEPDFICQKLGGGDFECKDLPNQDICENGDCRWVEGFGDPGYISNVPDALGQAICSNRDGSWTWRNINVPGEGPYKIESLSYGKYNFDFIGFADNAPIEIADPDKSVWAYCDFNNLYASNTEGYAPAEDNLANPSGDTPVYPITEHPRGAEFDDRIRAFLCYKESPTSSKIAQCEEDDDLPNNHNLLGGRLKSLGENTFVLGPEMTGIAKSDSSNNFALYDPTNRMFFSDFEKLTFLFKSDQANVADLCRNEYDESGKIDFLKIKEIRVYFSVNGQEYCSYVPSEDINDYNGVMADGYTSYGFLKYEVPTSSFTECNNLANIQSAEDPVERIIFYFDDDIMYPSNSYCSGLIYNYDFMQIALEQSGMYYCSQVEEDGETINMWTSDLDHPDGRAACDNIPTYGWAGGETQIQDDNNCCGDDELENFIGASGGCYNSIFVKNNSRLSDSVESGNTIFNKTMFYKNSTVSSKFYGCNYDQPYITSAKESIGVCDVVGDFVCDAGDAGWLRFRNMTRLHDNETDYYDEINARYEFKNWYGSYQRIISENENMETMQVQSVRFDDSGEFTESDTFDEISSCCPEGSCWNGDICVPYGTPVDEELLPQSLACDEFGISEETLTKVAYICGEFDQQKGHGWKGFGETMIFNPSKEKMGSCPQDMCYIHNSDDFGDYDHDAVYDPDDLCYNTPEALRDEVDSTGCASDEEKESLIDSLNTESFGSACGKCVPDMYTTPTHICMGANWTSKAGLMATMLLDYADGQNMNDYTIYCDEEDNYNLFSTSADTKGYFTDSPKCVFTAEDQGIRIFGLPTVPSGTNGGDFLQGLVPVAQGDEFRDYCSDADLTTYDGEFHECDNNEPLEKGSDDIIRVYPNPSMGMTFVMRYTDDSFGGIMGVSFDKQEAFTTFLYDPINALVQFFKSLDNRGQVLMATPEEYLPDTNFDRYYKSYNNGKEITAYFNKGSVKEKSYITFEYKGLSTPICSYLKYFNELITEKTNQYVKAFEIVENYVDPDDPSSGLNGCTIFASEEDSALFGTESYLKFWNELTSQIRLSDNSFSSGRYYATIATPNQQPIKGQTFAADFMLYDPSGQPVSDIGSCEWKIENLPADETSTTINVPSEMVTDVFIDLEATCIYEGGEFYAYRSIAVKDPEN